MGKLIYNPLLKEGFQETSEVTPGDISQLQAQITELSEDVRKKVPKFFTNIEELQIGEIGEYQGDTTADFTNGYFYKRNSEIIITDEQYTSTLNCVFGIRGVTADNITIDQYFKGIAEISGIRELRWHLNSVVYYTWMFLPALVVNQSWPDYVYNGTTYKIFPYLVCDEQPIANIDFGNPITIQDNDNAIYKGQNIGPGIPSSGDYGLEIGLTKEEPHYFYAWLRVAYGAVAFLTDETGSFFAYEHNSTFELPVIDYTHQYVITQIQVTYTPIIATYNPDKVQRIDTQPATDPAQFATAEQGDKADTALQSIAKGTDGSYIKTNVGAKNANNVQTVSAELTMQAIAGADANHKGLAEASDAKDYVDTYINNITIAQYDTLNDYYTLTLPTA